MSRVIALAMFMMLVPFTAMADHSRTPTGSYAESLAQELVQSLDQISHEASQKAREASQYREYAAAKAFSDLAQSAASLENKVFNSVIVPLYNGTSENVVKAYLQRLESSFSLLARDGQAVSRHSYYLASDVREVLYLKSDLLQALSANDRGRPGRPVRPGR